MRPPSILLSLVLFGASTSIGDEAPLVTFGGGPDRNMASPAEGLPSVWDPQTGENVRWTVELGTESYGGPLAAGGRVFVGTNNERPRNPGVEGDRGVLMAFRAADGAFLWQMTHAKLDSGPLNDWPYQGVCSTPTLLDDRLFYVSNRGELVCLDVEGFGDGENDGPFQGEERRGERDADVVWILDMPERLGVFPRNMSVSSPLVVGDLVISGTSQGPDDRGRVRAPEAPSVVAVRRESGEVVWTSAAPGDALFEGQWTSPTWGELGGRHQVLYPAGDGLLYSFDPRSGRVLWSFDGNRRLRHAGIEEERRLNAFLSSAVIWNDRVVIGTGRDPEHGSGEGDLWALSPEPDGGVEVVWNRGGEDFRRTLSTVAISGGLLYAASLDGFLHCLDATSGRHHWTYDALAAVWGSPLVADGKVYLGDEDGEVAILAAGRELEVLEEVDMGDGILSTPMAEDGVLYVMSRRRLFALAVGSETIDPAGGSK